MRSLVGKAASTVAVEGMLERLAELIRDDLKGFADRRTAVDVEVLGPTSARRGAEGKERAVGCLPP